MRHRVESPIIADIRPQSKKSRPGCGVKSVEANFSIAPDACTLNHGDEVTSAGVPKMTKPSTKRITAAKAEEVANVKLSQPATVLLNPQVAPLDFVDRLIHADLYMDAVRFLARALPVREAVWWGCLGIREGKSVKELASDHAAALKSAVRWVLAPTEDNRRVASTAAKRVHTTCACGCIAMAASLTGGSLGPAQAPPIAPPDHLSSRCVAGAIQIAVAEGDPSAAKTRFHRLLELGKRIANGQDTWEACIPSKGDR